MRFPFDPTVRTSVAYTHWLLGDYQQTMLTDLDGFQGLRLACLWMLGRKAEALEAVRLLQSPTTEGTEPLYLKAQLAADVLLGALRRAIGRS